MKREEILDKDIFKNKIYWRKIEPEPENNRDFNDLKNETTIKLDNEISKKERKKEWFNVA